MPLAWHQSELDQIARCIAQGPYPGAHAPRVSGLWPGFESRARAVTVHFHDRGVGHGAFHIRLAADRIKAFLPDTGLDPVAKALEDGVAFAKFFGPIAPGAACAHDSQHDLCKPSACSRLLALHRQACPGSARPSVPTACRSILIFPWRNCCTTGRFSTGPKRKRLVRHACGLGLSGYIKNRSKLKGFKYRFALVSLRRYAIN